MMNMILVQGLTFYIILPSLISSLAILSSCIDIDNENYFKYYTTIKCSDSIH